MTSEIEKRALLTQTQHKMPYLTPSEQAVGQAVLQRADEVIYWNIEEAVRQIGVSTATIKRFCRSVGCTGFKELKIMLAAELGGQTAPLEDIQADDAPYVIAAKVFAADAQAVQNTQKIFNKRAFDQAVLALNAANRVEIYGIGSSASLVFDAYYRLLKLGISVVAVTDSLMQAMSANMLRKGDVAIIISDAGRTRQTLIAAEYARRGGATIIALTSSTQSPLTDLADIVLITATARTNLTAEAMTSRIAHMAMIDALYVALGIHRRSQKQLELTQEIIESKRVP